MTVAAPTADAMSRRGPAQERFAGLDLFRGIAAVLVMLFHVSDDLGGLFRPASGYLAVDLFFLLSGFVIANAYDSRFERGGWHGKFVLVRLIRLYPLYCLAIAIMTVKFAVQYRIGASPVPSRIVLAELGFGILMLPDPVMAANPAGDIFPVNPPAWSLFFELIANAIFLVAHRWLRGRILIAFVAVAGLGFAATIVSFGSADVGNHWSTIWFGLPRACFAFFLGVLFRRQQLPMPELGAIGAVVLSLLLGAILCVPLPVGRALWDAAAVFVFFPAIVLLGSRITLGGIPARAALWAGAVSYAVYVLHVPFEAMTDAVLRHVRVGSGASPLAGPVFVLAVLVASDLIDRRYDTPLRRWLSRKLSSRRV